MRPARRARTPGLAAALLLLAGCAGARDPGAAAAGAQRDLAGPARVIVVGGGLAGLVAAYELEKRGVPVHLLEMREQLGGRVATAEYPGGLRAEAGLQELWGGNPLLGIARELGVPLEDGLEAYSSVVLDGVLHPYVQDTVEEYFASFLSADERAALDAWMARAKALHARAVERGLADPEVRALQDLSFEAWIRSFELPERAAAWIRLTLSCELAIEWSSFSALFGLLEFEIFFDGGVLNYHVRGGNSRLVEALAAAIRGPKTLSAEVTRIERGRGGPGARVRVHFTKDRRTRVLEAERVVLAVPFTHVHRIAIEPPLPQPYWDALFGLGFGRYVVVHLLVDRAAEPLWTQDGISTVVALSEGPAGVIYGPPSGAPPDAEQLVFSLLVWGSPARAFHMIPRERKIREVVAELERLFPGFASHVRGGHAYSYHPAAVATWPPGRSPLDAGSALFRRAAGGLHFAGDWVWNAHSDGAARSGIEAAERIAAELASPEGAQRGEAERRSNRSSPARAAADYRE